MDYVKYFFDLAKKDGLFGQEDDNNADVETSLEREFEAFLLRDFNIACLAVQARLKSYIEPEDDLASRIITESCVHEQVCNKDLLFQDSHAKDNAVTVPTLQIAPVEPSRQDMLDFLNLVKSNGCQVSKTSHNNTVPTPIPQTVPQTAPVCPQEQDILFDDDDWVL